MQGEVFTAAAPTAPWWSARWSGGGGSSDKDESEPAVLDVNGVDQSRPSSQLSEASFGWLRGDGALLLALVCFALFSNMALFGIFIGFVPAYVTAHGLSPLAVGSLFSAQYLFALVTGPVGAAISERYEWKQLMLCAGVLCSISAGTMSYGHVSFPCLLLSRALHGIAMTILWLASPAAVAATFKLGNRLKAMTLIYVVSTAAHLLSPAIAAVSWVRTGSTVPVLVVCTAANVISTISLSLFLPDRQGQQPGGAAGAEEWGWRTEESTKRSVVTQRELLSVAGAVPAASAVFLHAVAMVTLQAFLPFLLAKGLRVSVGGVADVYTYVCVVKIGVQRFMGSAMMERGPEVVCIFGLITYSILLPVLPYLSPDLPSAVLEFGGLGVAMAATVLPTFPLLATAATNHGGGASAFVAANSIWVASYNAGGLVGSAMESVALQLLPISDESGHRFVLLCLAICMGAAAAGVWGARVKTHDAPHITIV